MKPKYWNLTCVFGFLFSISCAPLWAEEPKNDPKPEPVLVTINKETTGITEPLLKNGYPDYVGAINAMQSKGVTPEKNAVVLILEIAGCDLEESEDKQEKLAKFCQALGIKPFPKKRPLMEPWHKHIEKIPNNKLPPAYDEDKSLNANTTPEERAAFRREALELADEYDLSTWSPEQKKLWVKWVESQTEILNRLDELEKRPLFYVPLINQNDDSNMLTVELNMISTLRILTFTVVSRIKLDLENHDFASARKRIRQLQIIADHQAREVQLVSKLVGYALRAIVDEVIKEYLFHPQLSANDINELLKIDNLSQSTIDVIAAYEIGERYMALSIVCCYAQEGVFDLTNPQQTVKQSLKQRQKLDYDLMLKETHRVYDEIVRIQKIKSRTERLAEMAELVKKVNQQGEAASKLGALANAVASKEERSKSVVHLLHALMIPSLDAVNKAYEKREQYRRLLLLTVELRRYQLQHGKYPDKLEQLPAKIVELYGTDITTDKPLKYKSNGTGFLVYSLGRDDQDQQGDNSQELDYSICTPDMKPKVPEYLIDQ